jgi:hypothetical protein
MLRADWNAQSARHHANDIALLEAWEGHGPIGRWCLRCLASGAHEPAGDPSGRAVPDRSIEFGRSPALAICQTGSIWFAVRACRQAPCAPTAPWVAWARSSRLHASSETNVSADSSFLDLGAAVLLYLFVAATSQDFVLALAAAAMGSDSVFFGLQRMI